MARYPKHLEESLRVSLHCFYEHFERIPFAEAGVPNVSMYAGGSGENGLPKGVALVTNDPQLSLKIIAMVQEHYNRIPGSTCLPHNVNQEVGHA